MSSSRLRTGASSAVTACRSAESCRAAMPARIADAGDAVEPEAEAVEMDERAAVALGVARGRRHQRGRCRRRVTTPLSTSALAAKFDDFEPPARNRDVDVLERDAGHALGLADRRPHRRLGFVEIGHDAGLDAARALMPDAEHAHAGHRARLRRRGSSAAMRQAILLVPISSSADDLGVPAVRSCRDAASFDSRR